MSVNVTFHKNLHGFLKFVQDFGVVSHWGSESRKNFSPWFSPNFCRFTNKVSKELNGYVNFPVENAKNKSLLKWRGQNGKFGVLFDKNLIMWYIKNLSNKCSFYALYVKVGLATSYYEHLFNHENKKLAYKQISIKEKEKLSVKNKICKFVWQKLW